jgi:hypothetical protein
VNEYIKKLSVTSIVSLLLLTLASACGSDFDKVYDQPLYNVHQALEKIEAPAEAIDTKILDFSVEKNTSSKITWTLKNNKMLRFRFTATLLPVDSNSTRVQVVVDKNIIDGSKSQPSSEKILHNMYKAVMIECIDSTLTGREFDVASMSLFRKDLMLLNAKTDYSQSSIDAGAKMTREKYEANIRKAYADEALMQQR